MTTFARARRARGRKRRVTALACACALAAWTARTRGAEANASSDVERLMGRLREARRLGPRDGWGANEGEDVDVDGARARARRRGAEAAVEGGGAETRDASEFVDADADAGKTNRGEEKDEDNETYTTCGLSSSVSSTGPDESDTVLGLMRLLRRARPFANAQQRVVTSGAAHVTNAQQATRDNTSSIANAKRYIQSLTVYISYRIQRCPSSYGLLGKGDGRTATQIRDEFGIVLES